ncbi:MAG: acyl carrier protein [Chloroflexia bacterium]
MDDYSKLKTMVAERLHVGEDEVTPEASFVEDLNADSLEVVELIMALEDEFGLTIPDEDAENIVTVQDALTYIEQHPQQESS